MIKRFIITSAFAYLFFNSHAQFDTSFAKTHILQCADSLTTGFKTQDWELFARYSYAGLIGSRGGKKEFINYMDMMFSPIPGYAWKQFEPGSILQVIKSGSDLQTVVELKSVLEWEGRRITTVSHLIGESWDGGLFWTFFDCEGNKNTALLTKPDLSEQLNIPEKKEKVEMIPSPVKSKNSP